MNNLLVKKLGVVVGMLIILIAVVFIFVVSDKKEVPRDQNTMKENPEIPVEELTQSHEIIFGTYGTTSVVFFTNPYEQNVYSPDTGLTSADPLAGVMVTEHSDRGQSGFDSREISNQKKITIRTSSEQIDAVHSFKFNADKTKIFVSVTGREANDVLVNRVYEVDLATLESKPVWVNTVYPENKYDTNGVVNIASTVDEPYMILAMGDCWGCGGHEYVRSVIVNLDTRKEVYLENAGDVKIDKGMITYRKFSQFEIPCDDEVSELCDGGKTYVRRTSGATFSAPLP